MSDHEDDTGNGDEDEDEEIVLDLSEDADGSATEKIPEVEELEERLTKVDAAMDLLQKGELDAAEEAIAELERRTARTD